ncbi:MAG: GntR family transcriptional regulator, partial [Thermomicrobiales bacterium]|nr:GntR family transcriptional regulator [Thermomicrobiales bacterium]
MRITIDRSQSMPLFLQIKGQIGYQIGMGVLKSGEKLPTIRQLAADIGVAPLTVVQAIDSLAADGLIETRPGVGSFVVDLHADALARSRTQMVEGLVDEHLQDVRQHGVPVEEYAQVVWKRVFHDTQTATVDQVAIFVGNYPVDTELFADLLADEFRPFRFDVVGRTVQDLATPTPETAALLAVADLVIAVPLRFGEARKLVGDRLEVVGLPLTLSPTTREHLAQLPPQAQIGMVVTEALFVQSM